MIRDAYGLDDCVERHEKKKRKKKGGDVFICVGEFWVGVGQQNPSVNSFATLRHLYTCMAWHGIAPQGPDRLRAAHKPRSLDREGMRVCCHAVRYGVPLSDFNPSQGIMGGETHQRSGVASYPHPSLVLALRSSLRRCDA